MLRAFRKSPCAYIQSGRIPYPQQPGPFHVPRQAYGRPERPSSARGQHRCNTRVSRPPSQTLTKETSLKATPADILKKRVCVRLHSESSEYIHDYRFLKRRPANTPRRRPLADGQLSSLYNTSTCFSSFGAACVMS